MNIFRRFGLCDICKDFMFRNAEWDYHCKACELKYGGHLLKSLCDPFDYAFILSNGMVIRLSGGSPTLKGEWLIFEAADLDRDECYGLSPFSFERGFQCRVSDVTIVADAPNGS